LAKRKGGKGGGEPYDFSAQATAMAAMAASMENINEKLTSTIEGQLKVLEQLQKTLASLAEAGEGPVADAAANTSKAAEGAQQVNESLEDIIKNMDEAGGSAASLAQAIAKAYGRPEPQKFKTLQGQLAKGAKKFIDQYKNTSSVLLFFQGLSQGVQNAMNVLKGATSIATSLASSLFNIGFAIASIPFQMFQKLMDFAAKATGGTEFAQARENVRKYFGDLRTGTSAMVLDVGTKMQGFAKNTGLSLYSVFGDAAEMLNYVNEMAQGIGAALPSMLKSFGKKQQGTLFAFAKGLGLGAEEMRSIGLYALASGKDAKHVFQDMTKMALQLEKAYGDNAKVLGRDVGKAIKDVGVFGNATVETLFKGATYARGLGVELDHIKGTLGAFGTFEQAADNVSMLTQAFGANIDTMELLQAGAGGDAAKQVDILRKSLFSAGVSADTMNNYNLKLLASSTGLSEEVARTVFSMNNQGRSLQDIQKQADAAKKKEEAYQETLRRLAPSIERVVRQFEMVGSFFEMFFKGMARALVMFGPFRDVVFDIRKALMHTFQIGFQFGMKFFGILENTFGLFTAMHNFFKQGGIEKFFNTFSGILERFTRSLATGQGDVKGLLDDFSRLITDFFSGNNPAFAGIAASFQKIMAVVGATIGAGIRALSPMVINALDFLINLIIDPKRADAQINQATGIMGPFVMPIYTALRENLPKIASKMGDLLWELLGLARAELWKGRDFMLLGMSFGTALASYALIPGIIKFGLGRLFQSSATSAITQAIYQAAAAAEAGKAGELAASQLSQGWISYLGNPVSTAMFKTSFTSFLGAAGLLAASFTAGWALGKMIADSVGQGMRDNAKQSADSADKFTKDILAEQDKKKKIEIAKKELEEQQALRQKAKEDAEKLSWAETGMVAGVGALGFVGGSIVAPGAGSVAGAVGLSAAAGVAFKAAKMKEFDANAAAFDLRIMSAQSIIDAYENPSSPAYKARENAEAQAKKAQEAAAEKSQRDMALSSLGAVTPENVQERIKSFKDMAAKLTVDEIKGINATMKSIRDAMDQIDWRVMGPDAEKNFKDKVLQVKIFQDLITSVTTSINAVIQANQTVAGFKPAWTTFSKAMGDVFMTINSYFDAGQGPTLGSALTLTDSTKASLKSAADSADAAGQSFTSMKGGVSSMVAAVGQITATIPTGVGTAQAIAQSAGSLYNIFNAIYAGYSVDSPIGRLLSSSPVATSFTTMDQAKSSIDAATQKVQTTMGAAKELFKASNEFNTELGKLKGQNFNVKASLDSLGNRLGFGDQVTLRNDKVVINLEVSVDMKADTLERILVLRKDSIIRDRLDWSVRALKINLDNKSDGTSYATNAAVSNPETAKYETQQLTYPTLLDELPHDPGGHVKRAVTDSTHQAK